MQAMPRKRYIVEAVGDTVTRTEFSTRYPERKDVGSPPPAAKQVGHPRHTVVLPDYRAARSHFTSMMSSSGGGGSGSSSRAKPHRARKLHRR